MTAVNNKSPCYAGTIAMITNGIRIATAEEVKSLAQRGAANQGSDGLTPAQIEAKVLSLLSDGKQSEAEDLIETYTQVHRENQRFLFLLASCLRSRFIVREAAPIFAMVADMGTNTVSGECAYHLVFLDGGKDVDKHFDALRALVEKNPNDLILRWMIAVQCRSLKKNEEGIKHYGKLLEKWNPGPVLVHQTYGNLLDETDRFEEALVERRKAVELEPAGWSYQGLGNTLSSLDRFKEANAAYLKSVQASPTRSAYWTSWAWGLLRENNLPEVIGKCKMATSLNPNDYRAWAYWGRALELQGKLQEALEKFKKAVEIDKDYQYGLEGVSRLEKQVRTQPAPAGAGAVPKK